MCTLIRIGLFLGKAPPTAGPGATAALWRRWCKHRVLMSKRRLQGKSPDPNAACGRKPFDSVAQKSAAASPGTAFDKIVRSGSVWASNKIIEYQLYRKSGLTMLSDPILFGLLARLPEAHQARIGFGNVAEPSPIKCTAPICPWEYMAGSNSKTALGNIAKSEVGVKNMNPPILDMPPEDTRTETEKNREKMESLNSLACEFSNFVEQFLDRMKMYQGFAEMSPLQISRVWDSAAAVDMAIIDFSKEVKAIQAERQ